MGGMYHREIIPSPSEMEICRFSFITLRLFLTPILLLIKQFIFPKVSVIHLQRKIS